jgi:hypothetical protein
MIFKIVRDEPKGGMRMFESHLQWWISLLAVI